MRKKVVLLCIAASFFACHSLTYAQEVKRTFGLSASIQESTFGIQLPVWIKNVAVIGPAFQFESVQDAGTDFGVGLFAKVFGKGEKIRPYGAFRFAVLMYNPPGENAESTMDIVYGVGFGGEYFFDPHFSISVEAQVNFAKSDKFSSRFGNPDGLNINTASFISANVYFGK